MRVNMTNRMGAKGSSINASSPHAERELTLSEIDSLYYNSEITREEAKNKVVAWALNTGNEALLPTVLRPFI